MEIEEGGGGEEECEEEVGIRGRGMVEVKIGGDGSGGKRGWGV